jgi:hypothetical protein
VSAEIIRLDQFRSEADPQCDLVTAMDVAIRDFQEILAAWGTDIARARAEECQRMLIRVYHRSVDCPSR